MPLSRMLEFLDKVHGDDLPSGWETYHDEQGTLITIIRRRKRTRTTIRWRRLHGPNM